VGSLLVALLVALLVEFEVETISAMAMKRSYPPQGEAMEVVLLNRSGVASYGFITADRSVY